MSYLIQILAPHPSNPDADNIVASKAFEDWNEAIDFAAGHGLFVSVEYFHDKGCGSSWRRMGKADFDAIAREYEEA